jgi:hypothetical protein
MPIEELSFNLREWSPSDFKGFALAEKKLKPLATSGGTTSDAFNNSCRWLLGAALNGDEDAVLLAIKKPIDARAAAYLICRSDEFREIVPLDGDFLAAIESVKPMLSRLTLMSLIEVFLKYFDLIGDSASHSTFGDFISRHLIRFSAPEESGDMISLANHRAMIFSLDAPIKLSEWVQEHKYELDVAFKKVGVAGHIQGRFGDLCRYRYYLESLKSMPVGQDDELLNELSKQAVFEAPAGSGQLLGHEIVSIMIDRSAKRGLLSDSWQKVILTIAGDPRVPKTSSKYQRWWALLGETRISLVRGWLSRFDLNLFLGVLDDYGRSSGDAELQRMFPSRKKFLEGLIDQGLVSQSRLFVNNRAEHYLKKNYDKEELPEYAKVNDSYRSMIYLQVGDLHMIEGSHSFKLWIFPKMPTDSLIFDYGRRLFWPAHLSSDIQQKYVKEFGSSAPRPASIVHTPSRFSWQNKAIDYLEDHGISLDKEKLFNTSDYKQFKRIYGI